MLVGPGGSFDCLLFQQEGMFFWGLPIMTGYGHPSQGSITVERTRKVYSRQNTYTQNTRARILQIGEGVEEAQVKGR